MNRIQNTTRLQRHALAAALVMAFSGAVHAQSTTGSVYGNAAPGSTITAVNESGFARTVSVDQSGRFNIGSLPVGNYTVTQKQGDQVVSTRRVVVKLGAGTDAGFASKAAGGGNQLEAINVSANNAAIDVTSVSTSTVLTSEQIDRIPLPRSAEAVALLAPGAVAGNSVFFGNAVSFGGSSVAENAYYINGFFSGNPMTNIGGYTLPFGSIAQQETYTGGYSAKYGRSNGGVINQIGKSGTNDLHFGVQVNWIPKEGRGDGLDRYFPNENFPAGYAYENPTQPGTLLDRGDKNKTWSRSYSAYIGGPIIKNRLLGFLSVEQEDGNRVSYPTSLAAARVLHGDSRDQKVYAKLNWNITDRHTLEGTYMGLRSTSAGYYNSYVFNTDVEGARLPQTQANDIRETDRFAIFKYTGYLTDNLTLSAMYGKSRIYYDSVPLLTGKPRISGGSSQNPAYWPAGTPSSGITNAQVSEAGVNARDDGENLRVELEWILGRHTLTAGIDNQKFEAFNEGNNQLTPRWIYSRTNSQNVNINTALGVGPPGQPYYVANYIYDNDTNMSLTQRGWYLEDKWQVTDNLLLSLGLRNDRFTNKNDAGVAYVETGDQWAPRLGFSWDAFGDSTFKLFGNAGRYYLALPQAVAVRGASSSVYTREYFTYTGINPATGEPTGLVAVNNTRGTGPAGPVSAGHETGQLKDANSFTPTDLKSSYQDEFIFGFQSQLNQHWNFGAKLTYRTLKTAMDDTCDSAAMEDKLGRMGIDPATVAIPGSGWVNGARGYDGGCFIVNVGDSNTFSFPNVNGQGRTQFQMTPQDWGWPTPMKRTYTALDLFFERPFDGRWEARLDYTFGKSYGNMEGQANSDTGQGQDSHGNGVATSQNWDGPAFMYYSMGYLPNDRRHQLKLRGSYAFNDEWMVSGNVRIQSGMPIACFGYFNDQGGDPAVNETDPAGYGAAYHTCFGQPSQPGKEYTPWTKRIDMSVAYKPAFLDHKLELSLNVFNLLNDRTVTAIDSVTETDVATISNTYRLPLRFQTPRYLMLQASYNW